MSCSYADALSPYEYKGKLGLKEVFDTKEKVLEKAKILSKLIQSSKHVVVHTGAGISTSAGIPDFRGPKGVWTLEKEGKKPEMSISFDDALPTKTHMALLKLLQAGFIKYIVSQNIDGLHLRSGVGRDYISELHGNMFIDQCSSCKRQFIRKCATTSMGQKCLGISCPGTKGNGRPCRGVLHDFVLDWEHALPDKDLDLAHYHSNVADLSICLGTTLQINPSGQLPLHTKKNVDGKLVICNLQPTKYDKKADLVISWYVDEIFSLVLEHLDLKSDEYNPENDPVKKKGIIEWTISDRIVSEMKKKYEEHLKARKIQYENNLKKRKSNEVKDQTPVKKLARNGSTPTIKSEDEGDKPSSKIADADSLEENVPAVKLEPTETDNDDNQPDDKVGSENSEANEIQTEVPSKNILGNEMENEVSSSTSGYNHSDSDGYLETDLRKLKNDVSCNNVETVDSINMQCEVSASS